MCGKHYKSSSRMKNHFRKRHLGKTKHQCKICKKFHTDSSSLKHNMDTHDAKSIPSSVTSIPRLIPLGPSWLSASLSMRRHSLCASLRMQDVTGSSSGRRGRMSISPSAPTTQKLLQIHLMLVQLSIATRGTGIGGPS